MTDKKISDLFPPPYKCPRCGRHLILMQAIVNNEKVRAVFCACPTYLNNAVKR